MFDVKSSDPAPTLSPFPIRPAVRRRHIRCPSFGSADYIPDRVSLREQLSTKKGVKMVAKGIFNTSYFCQTANPDASSEEEDSRRAISKAMDRERKRRKEVAKQLEGPKESSSFLPHPIRNWSWSGTSTATSSKAQAQADATRPERDIPKKQYGLKGSNGLAACQKKTVRVKISTLPDNEFTNDYPMMDAELLERWRKASPGVLCHYSRSSTSLAWNGFTWTRMKEEFVEELSDEERTKDESETKRSSLQPEVEAVSLEDTKKAQCKEWISSIVFEQPLYASTADSNTQTSFSAPNSKITSAISETMPKLSEITGPHNQIGAERSQLPLAPSTTPSDKRVTRRRPSSLSTASTLAPPVYPFITTRPSQRSSLSSLHPSSLSTPTRTPSEPSTTSSTVPSQPPARISKDSLEYAIRKDRARLQLKKEREEERAKEKMRRRMKMGGITYNMQSLTREERILVYKIQKEERLKSAAATNKHLVASRATVP